MPSILIQLDEATSRSLEKIAPTAQRKRAEFIRQAVKDAVRRHEYAAMRRAYLKTPDTALEADDWSNAEEYLA